VRVSDDAGRTGLGEASVTSVWSGETQAGTIALIHEVLAPLVVGADPFDTEWVSRQMDRAAFGNSFAKAAVEMALLDLQGQTLGFPVSRLLGGREPPPPQPPPPPGARGEQPAPLAPGGRGVGGEGAGIRLKFVVGAVEPDVAAGRARRMTDAGWTA